MPSGPTPPLRLSARVVLATSRAWIRCWRAVVVSMVGPITLSVICTAAAAHQVFSTSVLNTAFGRGSTSTATASRTGVSVAAGEGIGSGVALGSGVGDGEVMGDGVEAGGVAGEGDANAAARPP